MPRVYWLECPDCHKSFYAEYYDFRGKKIKLRCPWCHREFYEEESPRIIE